MASAAERQPRISRIVPLLLTAMQLDWRAAAESYIQDAPLAFKDDCASTACASFKAVDGPLLMQSAAWRSSRLGETSSIGLGLLRHQAVSDHERGVYSSVGRGDNTTMHSKMDSWILKIAKKQATAADACPEKLKKAVSQLGDLGNQIWLLELEMNMTMTQALVLQKDLDLKMEQMDSVEKHRKKELEKAAKKRAEDVHTSSTLKAELEEMRRLVTKKTPSPVLPAPVLLEQPACHPVPHSSCAASFLYMGQNYSGCVASSDQHQPWCSHSAVYEPSWSSCEYKCVQGDCSWQPSSRCVPEFMHEDTLHRGCANDGHSVPWCSHTRTYSRSWSFCSSSCEGHRSPAPPVDAGQVSMLEVASGSSSRASSHVAAGLRRLQAAQIQLRVCAPAVKSHELFEHLDPEFSLVVERALANPEQARALAVLLRHPSETQPSHAQPAASEPWFAIEEPRPVAFSSARVQPASPHRSETLEGAESVLGGGGLRGCSYKSSAAVVLGGRSTLIMLPQDMQSGTTVNYDCALANANFSGNISVFCSDGQIVANTSWCSQDPCAREKHELVQAYMNAYRGVARLYTEYQDVISTNASENAILQQYQMQKDQVLDDFNKTSLDLMQKNKKAQELVGELGLAKCTQQKMAGFIEKLSQQCKDIDAGKISESSIRANWTLGEAFRECKYSTNTTVPKESTNTSGQSQTNTSGQGQTVLWNTTNVIHYNSMFMKYTPGHNGTYDGYVVSTKCNIETMVVRVGQADKSIRIGLTSAGADTEDFNNGDYIGLYPYGKLVLPGQTRFATYLPTDVISVTVGEKHVVFTKNGKPFYTADNVIESGVYAKVFMSDQAAAANITASTVDCPWVQPPGCSREFEYGGKVHCGCSTADRGGVAWCSLDKIYAGRWAACTNNCGKGVKPHTPETTTTAVPPNTTSQNANTTWLLNKISNIGTMFMKYEGNSSEYDASMSVCRVRSVELKVLQLDKHVRVGLTPTLGGGPDFQGSSFIGLYPDGIMHIFSGTVVQHSMRYTTSDRIRLTVEGGKMYVFKNSESVYNVTIGSSTSSCAEIYLREEAAAVRILSLDLETDAGNNATVPSKNRSSTETADKAYAVGDRVEGLSTADKRWYPATIQKVNGDGTYQIDWDDGGTRDRTKTHSELRKVNTGKNATVPDKNKTSTTADDKVTVPNKSGHTNASKEAGTGGVGGINASCRWALATNCLPQFTWEGRSYRGCISGPMPSDSQDLPMQPGPFRPQEEALLQGQPQAWCSTVSALQDPVEGKLGKCILDCAPPVASSAKVTWILSGVGLARTSFVKEFDEKETISQNMEHWGSVASKGAIVSSMTLQVGQTDKHVRAGLVCKDNDGNDFSSGYFFSFAPHGRLIVPSGGAIMYTVDDHIEIAHELDGVAIYKNGLPLWAWNVSERTICSTNRLGSSTALVDKSPDTVDPFRDTSFLEQANRAALGMFAHIFMKEPLSTVEVIDVTVSERSTTVPEDSVTKRDMTKAKSIDVVYNKPYIAENLTDEEKVVEEVAKLRKAVDEITKSQTKQLKESEDEVKRWWNSLVFWWALSILLLAAIVGLLTFIVYKARIWQVPPPPGWTLQTEAGRHPGTLSTAGSS